VDEDGYLSAPRCHFLYDASTRTQALPCPVQVYRWVTHAHVTVEELVLELGSGGTHL
jgi:hypothetical protein